jgi:hypothetical protein
VFVVAEVIRRFVVFVELAVREDSPQDEVDDQPDQQQAGDRESHPDPRDVPAVSLRDPGAHATELPIGVRRTSFLLEAIGLTSISPGVR